MLDQTDREFEDTIDKVANARRVELARADDFPIGTVHVRPSKRTISGPAGEVMLEPKVMQVLVALGTPVGAIQSRDDLIERCWDGRVIGDTSINRVISLVRKGLIDVGAENVTLENVPKVGYHLNVQGLVDEETHDAAAGAMAGSKGLGSPKSLALAAGVCLAFVAAMALWFFQPSTSTATQRLRIAVLPLEISESVDPLYGRGFETELRAALAQIGDIEVFSSNSARTFAQEGLTPAQISERLDADLVWTGSIDAQAQSILVKASLIDPEEGRAINTFDASSAPDTAHYMPMRLARSTARAINRPLAGDVSQNELPDRSYRLFLSALGIVASRDMDKITIAEDILRDYLADHPDFAFGQMVLGKAIMLSPGARGEEMNMIRFREGGEILARAYELDPDDPQIMAARAYWGSKEMTGRVELLKASVAKDPGNVESLVFLGEMLRSSGRTAEAVEVYGRIISIDPLWAQARIAIDEALDLGMREEAKGFAQRIQRASTKPWLDLLVEADLARIEGDYSEAIRASERAFIAAPSQARTDIRQRVAAMRYYVGAPDPTARKDNLRFRVWHGELAELEEFYAIGFVHRVFFQAPDMVELATPMFVQEGRSEDLLEIFDAYGMPLDKFTWGLANINGELRDIAPYVVIALREAGREEEAQQILDAALESDAAFASITPDGTGELYDRARLMAVAGKTEEALGALDQAVGLGLPHSINPLKEPMLMGPMAGDPAFASLKDNARFTQIAGMVDAKRDKERADTRAMSGSDR